MAAALDPLVADGLPAGSEIVLLHVDTIAALALRGRWRAVALVATGVAELVDGLGERVDGLYDPLLGVQTGHQIRVVRWQHGQGSRSSTPGG